MDGRGVGAVPAPPGGQRVTERRRLAVVCMGILADLAEGLTTVQIAKGLAARGVPSPTGKPWSAQAVQDLLKREGVSQ